MSYIRSHFCSLLSEELNLVKLTPPLFLSQNSGLNDDLNDEPPIQFTHADVNYGITQSLAKWKRYMLS
jgi:aspartate--ammonia ligase